MDKPVMTRSLHIFFALALALGMAQSPARADRLEDAETALRAGNAGQAASLLQGYQPTSPSARVRALWVLALVEMAANQPQRAIPLLEKLVILVPNDADIRLELGRAYVLAGKDSSARKQLEAAQAGALSGQQREAASAHLQQIEKRKKTESYLTFALVPESNAVKRTSAETVDIGGYTFTLNPNARKEAGVGLRLGFGHAFLPRYSDTLSGRFGVHFDGTLYRQSDISEATVMVEAGLDKAFSARARVGAGLLGQLRFLGGAQYTRGVGGYLSFSTLVGTAARLNARAEVMKLTYPGYAGADGLRTTLTFGYRQALSPSLLLMADLSLIQMNATLAEESGRNGTLSLGLQKAFEGGLVVSGTLSKGRLRRDGASSRFGIQRRDDTASLSLRAYHSSFQLRGFAPTLELTYERQKSNIVLNNYSNTRVSVGLTKRF